MTKKILAFTLGLMMVLLAGCSVKPAEEKESTIQAQTVPFPAGDEISDEEPQTETQAETSELQKQATEETVSKEEIALPPEPAAEASKEQKTPQAEAPQSGQEESQTPAQKTETEQTQPSEKEKAEETPITAPQAAGTESADAPEPAKAKSIYDYEFDVEAIRQELLSIGTGMGLNIDDSLTPDSSSWGNPVTASKDFQGAALERSLKDYVRSMPELITAYGGTPIQYFTIYVESIGGGSYRFYFLY